MVKIVWSRRALEDRKRIFSYWNERNKSPLFSNKLNLLFKQTLSLVSKYPYLGKQTDFGQVRVKFVRNYCIFYILTNEHLVVLSIWDSYQNPKNIKL
jgi:plasmid stabilization system protein ParE